MAERARGSSLGEDVVELVAAAAQAADVGTLAIAILDLGLGQGLVVVVVVILLGEAEVDERAMPGVSESHRYRCGVRPEGEFPC